MSFKNDKLREITYETQNGQCLCNVMSYEHKVRTLIKPIKKTQNNHFDRPIMPTSLKTVTMSPTAVNMYSVHLSVYMSYTTKFN